jgi:pilus assembly protein Flp/PilA
MAALTFQGVPMFPNILIEEDGAQVVEYALIVSVVSLALIVLLLPLATGTSFSDLASRVSSCLSGTGCA